MIKSGEYIQILQFMSINKEFLTKYSFYENLELIETCKRFDELRILHMKYKRECDNYNVFPNKPLFDGLVKLNMLQEDIQRICNEFKIRVVFFDSKTTEYKHGQQCSYWHQTTNVSDLIIFNNERKPSSVSH